jgi:hypothetical protein
MKFDKSKHKHAWRVQKGCHVEWVDGSKKLKGVVKKVISVTDTWGTPQQVLVQTDEKNTFTVDVDKIRILKTQSAIRKESYKD